MRNQTGLDLPCELAFFAGLARTLTGDILHESHTDPYASIFCLCRGSKSDREEEEGGSRRQIGSTEMEVLMSSAHSSFDL